MGWRNLRIWVKLLVVFGTCFTIYIGISVWNNVALTKLEFEKQKDIDDQITMLAFNNLIREQTILLQNKVIEFQQTENPDQLQNATQLFSNFVKTKADNTRFQHEELNSVYTLKLKTLSQPIVDLNRLAQQSISTKKMDKENGSKLFTEINQTLAEVFDGIKTIESDAQKVVDGIFLETKNEADQQKALIIYIQLGVISIFILLFIVLVVSIEKSKRRTLQIVKQLSNGNMAVDFGQMSKDEFGQIAEAMSTLQWKIRDIVNHIHETIASVKKASSELASGSQLISDGANNQAATSNEISATMDQISIISRQTTESANQTSQIAQRANLSVKKGADDVNEAYRTIEEIAEKNSIISDISYQTKILSINASVEAARAAQFGKGFGVIADQVKRLAEDSQKSAGEIEFVSLKGVELTRELANQLSDLVEEFQKTADLINEVSSSGNEQYEAIQQITRAIQELNNITQQNASSSEELAASSEQLVNLADELEESLSFFKMDAEEKSPEVQTLGEQSDDEEDAETEHEYSNTNIVRNEFEEEELSQNLNDLDDSGYTLEKLFADQKNAIGEFDDRYFDDESDPVNSELTRDDVFGKQNNKPSENENEDFDYAEIEKQTTVKGSGVRINLTDNDEMDNKFKKMK
ncbi:MAG: methyl-accepting chemotaxis protein [Prolixibacteraceae bacterium]